MRRTSRWLLIGVFVGLLVGLSVLLALRIVGREPVQNVTNATVVVPHPSYGGGGGGSPAPVQPSTPPARVVVPVNVTINTSVEASLYAAYLQTYLQPDGGVISNAQPVSWCPSACIGCDADVTSEGIGRLARVAVLEGDKATLDKVNAYAKTVMKNPAGYLDWKLTDGVGGSCGGNNSAVDGELILIGALLKADQRWPNNGYGMDARSLMAALKPGLINGTYLPMCMYEQGGVAAACEPTVFLGYLNLPVLKQMCAIDSFWCGVHDANKALLIKAVQGRGIYSTYYMTQNRWAYQNAPIHPNWCLLMLSSDGDADAWSAVKPFYDQQRPLILAGGQLCQEFNPSSGCRMANPALDVYATWLEMAGARNDTQLVAALRAYIDKKIPTLPTTPLAGVDNFQNIITLSGLGATH